MDTSSRKFFFISTAVIVAVIGLFALAILHTHGTHQKQQQELAREQAQFSKSATADPILGILPYGTTGYDINATFRGPVDAVSSKRTLVVKVDVVLYDADYRVDATTLQARITERQQAALAYIRSKGFDPTKYQIEYYVPPH